MTRLNQYLVNCVSTITPLMSGTTAPWQFEVVTVWVDDVSTAFTWSSGTLTIGSYTSGVVKVESVLYLLSGTLGGYHPKDPSNPASDLVYWDDRVVKFPNISTSIKDIDSGIISSSVSTLSFFYRGGWDELVTYETNFVNKRIDIYREGTLLYSGYSDGKSSSRGAYTVTLGNFNSVLDQECTFGDPAYMCRIDRSSSNSYYTGSSLPEKWDGQAIPMVFGPRSAWQDTQQSAILRGQWVSGSPPLNLGRVDQSVRAVGTGIILKVIPTSDTTGILCRTPSFQTLTSNKTSTAPSTAFVWTKVSGGSTSEHPNLIFGQLVSIDNSNGLRLTQQSARFIAIGQSTNITTYELSAEDTASTNVTNYDFIDYDTKSHLCCERPVDTTFTDANFTISSVNITEGTQTNKLWTISALGLNFYDHEFYYVNTDITGSKSAPEVAEWILSSHGLTTDSSFATLGASLTEKASMHVGNDKEIQTINEALSEINRSLLTLIKRPLDGSTYSIQKIDTSAVASETLTDEQISNVRSNEVHANTYGIVEFEPKYIRGSRVRDEVYSYNSSTAKNYTGITKSKLINHVLDQKDATRFSEITEFWCSPNVTAGFILLDETISINIGDYIQVNHEDFTGLIMVTSISPKDLGFSIQGRLI